MFKDMIVYYQMNGAYVMQQFLRHFLLSIYGVIFASIVAIPLGLYVAKKKNLSKVLIGFANVLQTVPSLAMLAILMLAMGIGANTVIFAIFLYSLLPLLSNTVTGIRAVSLDVLDAAKGMGMTNFQIMKKVQLPLALSVIMGGVRNALVVAIGVAAIGTFIGAGGLGDIISHGISVANGEGIILAGALPTALMAVLADVLLGRLEKILAKKVGV